MPDGTDVPFDAAVGRDVLCGYARGGPAGFVRIYDGRGAKYFDVPEERIVDRKDLPGTHGETLAVLIVDSAEGIQPHRPTPAELVRGPIPELVPRVALAFCYMWWTRTRRCQTRDARA
jgi:hypothetical protein